MRTIIAVVVICSLAMAITYMAIAANTAPAESIGVVNVDQVLLDYGKAKQAAAQLKTMETELEGQLRLMARSRLLTKQEMDEIMKLQTKANPTQAEKARISALENLDKQREEKLKGLQSQQNINDQQKQAMAELQGYVIESGKVIEQAKATFQRQIDEKNAELGVEVGKDIRAAVGVIAQENNTSVVLNKSSVIVGGTDLTEKVVKQLNGKS